MKKLLVALAAVATLSGSVASAGQLHINNHGVYNIGVTDLHGIFHKIPWGGFQRFFSDHTQSVKIQRPGLPVLEIAIPSDPNTVTDLEFHGTIWGQYHTLNNRPIVQ